MTMALLLPSTVIVTTGESLPVCVRSILLKLLETVPPTVDGLTTKDGPHLYEDMLTILATSGWTSTEIIE